MDNSIIASLERYVEEMEGKIKDQQRCWTDQAG